MKTIFTICLILITNSYVSAEEKLLPYINKWSRITNDIYEKTPSQDVITNQACGEYIIVYEINRNSIKRARAREFKQKIPKKKEFNFNDIKHCYEFMEKQYPGLYKSRLTEF